MGPHKGLGRSLDSFVEGKGLEAFFSTPTADAKTTVQTAPIDQITVNRQQPRTEFADTALQDLANSIKKEGVLQPLVVTPLSDGRFELIAGERRLRASRLAGLTEVPVIVRQADSDKMLELALVENIQRENLNPIEEAKGYQNLVEQFGLTQSDVAERVGKSREHVANLMRLLKLPKLIQEDVAAGRLSSGHARALLSLPSLQDQLNFREKILAETLTVRDVEQMIQERAGGRTKKIGARLKKDLSPQIKLLIDNIQQKLGTKVRIHTQGNTGARGQLVIEFFSLQDLDRIYRTLTQ